jgi:hypothetical protein
MIGITGGSKDRIGNIVEDMFDRLALKLLGNLPRFKNSKKIIFSTQPNLGLPHLFVQAMQNKALNAIEQDVLKGLLTSADGYIEALKSRTKSNLTERLDGLVREASINKDKVSSDVIRDAIKEELDKARSHMKAIAESEATKLRNFGTLMDIGRVSASLGDNDPTVFFVVVKDGVTCKECIRLHLLPDGITPRLWKFSELKQGYHKRGEDYPSAFGLHPHCRCTLTYLSRGFGFDEAGKVSYIGENYNAHLEQQSA